MIRIISRRYGCREDVPTVTVTFGGGRPITPISGDVEINVPAGTAWADIGNYGTLPVFLDFDTGKESLAGWFTFTRDGTDFIESGYEINEDITLWASYPVAVTFAASDAILRLDDVREVAFTGDTTVLVRKGSRLGDVTPPKVDYDGLEIEGWSNLANVTAADVTTWEDIDSVLGDPEEVLTEDKTLYVFPIVPIDEVPDEYERLLYVCGGADGSANAYANAGYPHVDTELRIEAGDVVSWGGRKWTAGTSPAVIGGARYTSTSGWGLRPSAFSYLSNNTGRNVGAGAFALGGFVLDTNLMRVAFLKSIGTSATAQLMFFSAGEGRTSGLSSSEWPSTTPTELASALATYGASSPTIWLIGRNPSWTSAEGANVNQAVTHYFHKKNGVWVAKMLACRRKEDGVCGFYDIVRERFFTTPQGTLYAPFND